MKIVISPEALNWFKEEMGLTAGDKIKFFTKIYSSSPVQRGYGIGFTKDNEPFNIAASTVFDGIEFYVEEMDEWFFDGHDLHVHYNADLDEILFDYVKADEQ